MPVADIASLAPDECGCGCGGEVNPGRRFMHGHGPTRRNFYTPDESGCWSSVLPPDTNGYIQDSTYSNLHVRVYTENRGPVPKGYHVHHKCRRKGCVNPDHLEVLPRKDHFRIKGHGTTKLSYEEVAEIRERAASGETQRSIAKAFGVSQPNVCDILKGRSWA